MNLAPYIDHTLLRVDARATDIETLCQEAIQHSFHSVCVHSSRIVQAAHLLELHAIQVCSVVGFPLGAMDSDAKRYEAEVAVDLGATEVDMVLNLGRFFDGDEDYVIREIRDVIEAADGAIVKVILETQLLKPSEIVRACELVLAAEAHFVKTSTGWNGGTTVEHVKLMRETVGRNCGVKASGGIRTREQAIALLEAGASRLGCSGSVALMTDTSPAGESSDY